MGGVGGGGLRGPGREIRGDIGKGNAGQGAVGHGRVVGVLGFARVVFLWKRSGIGAGAAAFGGGNQEIGGSGSDDGGVELGGDKARGPELQAGRCVQEVENGDGIGNGVGGEERFFVGRESEAFGIAAAVFLAGEFCGKDVDNFSCRGVEDFNLVAVGEGDEEFSVAAIQKKGGGMRAAFQWRFWFFEGDDAVDGAFDEVEFSNGGGVPERDKGAATIVGDDRGVRERAGNAFESGEIEAVKNFAVGGVQEDGFVGVVAGNEDLFDAIAGSDAETRGIRDIAEVGAANCAARNFAARREGKKTFRSDDSIFEGVNGDAIAETSLLFAQGIGERSDGSVEMFAIDAEGEAEEVGLLGVATKTIVGEIAEFVGGEIENREGLFFAGGVGAVAAVEENGKATVGRERGDGGEIVDRAGLAGDRGKEFAVGELERLGLRKGWEREQENECKRGSE